MDFSERELLVFRIRSGVYRIPMSGFTIKIYTPTIEDELEACDVYQKSYYEALNDDIMTEEDCFEWMIENDLWSYQEDKDIETYKEEMKNLKVNIYKKFNNARLRESARAYLRAAESALTSLASKKNIYQANTCEGIAQLDRSLFLLGRCSFVGTEQLDLESVNSNTLLNKYYSLVLNEAESRELARNDPWRSIWALRETGTYNLFSNKDRELSMDQKNLLVWSRMYDNIQESMDCPSDKIIEDDDALDGWFVEQKRKQDKERIVDQVEASITNDKIKNSQEILLFADNETDAKNVDELNSVNAKMIKKERKDVLKQKGSAVDLDFADQKMRINNLSDDKFKSKFRR